MDKIEDPSTVISKRGESWTHRWRPEFSWWNDCVDDAIDEKRKRFKHYKMVQKRGIHRDTAVARASYVEVRRLANCVVWLAKSDTRADSNEFIRISKQVAHENKDVVREKYVRNDTGQLSFTDKDKIKAWVEHYSRLLNVEFDWPKEELPKAAPIEGPAPPVSSELIRKATSKMKNGAAGPTGITPAMIRASGEDGEELLRLLSQEVFSGGCVSY